MAFGKQETKITLIVCIVILCYSIRGDAEQIGVNYGGDADNLPSADQVVTLMKNNNIGKMRMFTINKDALKAFENSGIDAIVGILNTDLQGIATSQDAANGWVNDNIKPFYPATNIKYIAVGNEVLGMPANDQYVSYLVPAMNNIQTALESANLQNNIKVSTTHATTVLGTSYPPSSGAFSDSVKDTMSSILQFLEAHGSPFMANVYPYFSYISNEGTISLDYALFRSTSAVVTDGNLSYMNLFDAMVDALLSAMESLGHSNLPIVITESGWPSQGNDAATIDNAQTYNNNLIKHVLSTAGTPKRPGASIETYVFALFNEDLKPGDETERHFGLFYPNQQPVYAVNFSP
uniref:TSA: Wollemia nobilis Ref_Wollemi_Transcript_13132_1327 transcribed RNA sequence n=1 Tax=Wollemia nobilis TaxID=56998 RepID=A0A0C9QR68_9CONI